MYRWVVGLGVLVVAAGVLSVLALAGVLGSNESETASAYATLGGVLAAGAAGVFAARAAVETSKQRIHATTPAFIEVSPSGPIPVDVVGRDTIEARGRVTVSPGFAKDPDTIALEHPCLDHKPLAYFVEWWKILERAPSGHQCDEWEPQESTLGDLRAVIIRPGTDWFGISVPLVNVGGGVAVIDDAEVEVDACVARGGRARGANRNRVPPQGTTRISFLLCRDPGGSVTFSFTYRDIHLREPRRARVKVEEGVGSAKWFVTDVRVLD